MVNGSVYGLLQVPRDYVVCSEVCDLHTLTIPVAQREMDGYSFQCVGIDYATNTVSLGDETVLNVITSPQGLNSKHLTLHLIICSSSYQPQY